MASEGLHEARTDLDDAVVDRHRAITSIMEELEAVDWYDQRVSATDDATLAEVLGHNRDEEKEHASMTLEWLRRQDPVLDRHLRTYLFTEGSIVAEEHEASGSPSPSTTTAAEPGRARETARSASAASAPTDDQGVSMNHLFRDLAPISEKAWHEIETEAKRTLENFLAARRLVDFTGPHGWAESAITLGTINVLPNGPVADVEGASRNVQPLVELRARFALERSELDAIDRGHTSPDIEPVVDAARRIAAAEDKAVFHGYTDGRITGIVPGSPHEPVELGDSFGEYPRWAAMAVARLRDAGVEGPYGIALGPRCYAGILETTEDGGYPVLERLRLILGGPVVYAPAVDGAVVLSMRGEDFELYSGQDVSIGYDSHDAERVSLYLEESLTFHAHTPEAAVALRYP